MTDSEIKSFVLLPIKYKYRSYDYHKALDEAIFTNVRGVIMGKGVSPIHTFIHTTRLTTQERNRYNYYITPELVEKYANWKIGKLNMVKFKPDQTFKSFYIGNKFKFSKCFYPIDFGVNVKPIISKSDDKFDLIGRGLAESFDD